MPRWKRRRGWPRRSGPGFRQGPKSPAAWTRRPYTDVVKLTGSFNVTNGLAQTNDLNLEIPGATVAARGSVNLANNTLDLHLTAVLSQGFSQKVGGTEIGGFLQTALANNKGELVLPVLATGSFQSPRFAPDLEQVARLKMQNLLPSFNNPAELTTGILGSMLGGKPGGRDRGLGGILGTVTGQNPNQPHQQQPDQTQPQQPQPQQQNPLNQLLNSLLGGKKKQRQQPQAPQPPPPPQPPQP